MHIVQDKKNLHRFEKEQDVALAARSEYLVRALDVSAQEQNPAWLAMRKATGGTIKSLTERAKECLQFFQFRSSQQRESACRAWEAVCLDAAEGMVRSHPYLLYLCILLD